jgi:hypothetical protein
MGELYADVLMNLTTAYAAYGQRELALKYAEMHIDQRIRVERAIGRTPNSEMSFEGMAYTALSLGLILNERYEEAIKYAAEGREILKRLPSFGANNYWPHWAYTYHAWALIGLGRYSEALPLILDTLRWRERHFGRDDTESLKYVLSFTVLIPTSCPYLAAHPRTEPQTLCKSSASSMSTKSSLRWPWRSSRVLCHCTPRPTETARTAQIKSASSSRSTIRGCNSPKLQGEGTLSA